MPDILPRRLVMKLFRLALGPGALALQLAAAAAADRPHPCLVLTPPEVATIRTNLGRVPLFDAAFNAARARLDRALAAAPDVPVPRDAVGATSLRHEQNGEEMRLAGLLYQFTGDPRYAARVKDLLARYADLYPTLGKHPAATGATPGRLFWQPLDESVWLVHVSQAYDCIYDYLAPADRARFETDLFRPMVKFLSEDCRKEFDLVHNHGTWAATAVGMTGCVMGDDTMVRQALYGSKMDGTGGYLRQLDELFSPDGYYCEGPYYGRYALMPFYLFAEVIQNNRPDLKILDRRDALLRKALYVLLQQTDADGAYFPINDAMKDMTLANADTVFSLDHAYLHYGRDPQLLSIARRQGGVTLDAAGLAVAQALAATPQPPEFPYASLELTDGAQGQAGGLGILRSGRGPDQSVALLKYTAFGMGHGHYDKLGFLYYDQGHEIIPDYGSARFVNIEQKYGGRYLPENTSFAKQTIAHNTVVVDERSHYEGAYDTAKSQHSDRQFFDAHDPDFQVMSAVDTHAVPGVAMQRTIAMVRDARLGHPLVLDVFRLVAAQPHRYDYPFHYQGQFLQTNVKLTPHATEQRPLGAQDGYQHLWVEAEGQAAGPVVFTWMCDGRYYTITTAADDATRVFFTRIGANDPNFNLRHEPAFLLRQEGASHVFASVIEPHGRHEAGETTTGGEPVIRSVRVLAATAEGTVVRITGDRQLDWTLMIANAVPAAPGKHTVRAGGETFSWEGNAALVKH